MATDRRSFLRGGMAACLPLSGTGSLWCEDQPLADARGDWTGYPPDPRVSGWHHLVRRGGGPPSTRWFDARAQVWRARPDAFEAEAPGEMAEQGWAWPGLAAPPPRWSAR